MEWRELCWSKLYFIYMIYTFMLSHFSLLVRNVITHSLWVICVWILWWSRTLCSWEQMVRWITIENFTLEDVRIQYSNMMWNWDIGFCNICIMFWTCYLCYFSLFNLFPFVKIGWPWFESKIFSYSYLISF